MQKNSLNYKNIANKAFSAIFCTVLCIFVVFAAFRVFIAVNYFGVCVVGHSMEGTLHDGDCVYAMHSSNPKRGDIAIIDTGEKLIIKRVIALGGDVVELKAGVLYLNGEKVDEPYVSPANNALTDLKVNVSEGHMFFMGDNRKGSEDCRTKYNHEMSVSKVIGIVADWSMSFKGAITAFNNFYDNKVNA